MEHSSLRSDTRLQTRAHTRRVHPTTWTSAALVAAAVLALAGCTSSEPDGAAGSPAAAATGGAATGATGETHVAQAPGGPVTRSASGITVTGTGTAAGAPDRLVTRLGVEVQRDTVAQAVQDANQAAEDLIVALRDSGVAEEDIQTAEVSVRPQFAPPPGPTPGPPPEGPAPPGPPRDEVVGYVARNVVQASIPQVDQAGEVLQAAVDAAGDAVRIESVGFELDDPDELRGQAREDAFADAQATAQQYADLAGVELGALVQLTEGVRGGAPVPVAADVAHEAASSVPIEPGQTTVQVTVTATWEIG